MREAREAGLRLEALVEENKDLRAQLEESRARSASMCAVMSEERGGQTDPAPSEEEIELRCRLEAKEGEAEALESKLREYQSMLEEAQGEMEEMQVNVRTLKQSLEEAEAKASAAQSQAQPRPVRVRRSSQLQRSAQDLSPVAASGREGVSPSMQVNGGGEKEKALTPTKRARGDDNHEARVKVSRGKRREGD